MNTIDQAREVSKRLHLGASIANDRNIDKDFATIAKAAANTIDAMIAELNDERMNCAQADDAVEQMAAELVQMTETSLWQARRISELLDEVAALKAQEPVAFYNPQIMGGFYWAKPTQTTAPISVTVKPLPLYSAAGAQPSPQYRRC